MSGAGDAGTTGDAGENGEGDLVFGMGAEAVVPRDWPSMTSAEVEAVLGGGDRRDGVAQPASAVHDGARADR